MTAEPDTRDVLFNFGVICGFLVELECLESSFRRLVALFPDYAVGYGELGFLAQARGDLGGAISEMQRGYAAAPKDDLALSGLAQMLIPAGQSALAIELMKDRLKKNRGARAYGGRSMLTLYGWALLELRDSTGAARLFIEVLDSLQNRERAGQTTYQLYRERAAIHALMGNRSAAIAAMRTAFNQGWRLYGAWTLVDPMFQTMQDDPAVMALVDKMRADVRQKRERLGLAAQPSK